MEVIEERPMHKGEPAARVAKPLQACFKKRQEAEHQWQDYDAEIMPGFLIDDSHRALTDEARADHQSASVVLESAAAPYRLPRRVIEEYAQHIERVRSAQARGKHRFAIKLTTRAIRSIRQQPKFQRGALNRQTQELLNLRSVSLIAVGECGEAWRCITLMAKLWVK